MLRVCARTSTLNRVIAGTVGLYEEAELTFKRSLAAQMQMQDTQVVSLPLCCCCAFCRPNRLSELLRLRNGRCFYAIELLNTSACRRQQPHCTTWPCSSRTQAGWRSRFKRQPPALASCSLRILVADAIAAATTTASAGGGLSLEIGNRFFSFH